MASPPRMGETGSERWCSVVTWMGPTSATFSRVVKENPPTERAITPARISRAPSTVPGRMRLKATSGSCVTKARAAHPESGQAAPWLLSEGLLNGAERVDPALAISIVLPRLAQVVRGGPELGLHLAWPDAAELPDDQRGDPGGGGRGRAGSRCPAVARVAGPAAAGGAEHEIEGPAGLRDRADQSGHGAHIIARENDITARRAEGDQRLAEIGVGSQPVEIRGAQRPTHRPQRRDGQHVRRLGRNGDEVVSVVEVDPVPVGVSVAGGREDDHALLIGVGRGLADEILELGGILG